MAGEISEAGSHLNLLYSTLLRLISSDCNVWNSIFSRRKRGASTELGGKFPHRAVTAQKASNDSTVLICSKGGQASPSVCVDMQIFSHNKLVLCAIDGSEYLSDYGDSSDMEYFSPSESEYFSLEGMDYFLNEGDYNSEGGSTAEIGSDPSGGCFCNDSVDHCKGLMARDLSSLTPGQLAAPILKYHVIVVGRVPRIYRSRLDFWKMIYCYPYAKGMSFWTFEEASRYLAEQNEIIRKQEDQFWIGSQRLANWNRCCYCNYSF